MTRRKIFMGNMAIDKGGHKFKILTAFSSQSEKVTLRCMTCDYIFEKILQSINTEKMFCPRCKKKVSRSRSDAAYKRKFYNKFGNDYEIIGVYQTQNDKILIKHKKCGTISERFPAAVYRSSIPCPNKKCRSQEAKQDLFGISIKDFADIIRGSIVPKDKIGNEYVQTAYDEFDELEKHYCKNNHAYHLPVDYTYKNLQCPFCSVLSSEEYKKFELQISVKMLNRELLNRQCSKVVEGSY